MSLIEHTFFPRSAFDMDWMRPEPLLGLGTLDIFDPFDELDRTLGRNLMWLDVPDVLRAAVTAPQPRVPRKYRIQMRCEGFSPNSIKTELSEDKKQLVVHAKEGAAPTGDKSNYTLREFRRTYNLPDNVDTDQLVSFMTSNKRLIIEMPIKEKQQQQQQEQLQEDLLPRITDIEGGKKQVQMNMVLPSNIDPAKIKVTCKDRDVIVQAESKQDTSDQQSQLFYYRRTTLPENANLNELKCTFDNNRLSINAPLDLSLDQSARTIPIEFAQKQQQQLQQGGGQQQPQQQQQGQQATKPEQVDISGDEVRGAEQTRDTTGEEEKGQQQEVSGSKVEGKQGGDLSSKVKAWSLGDKQQEVEQ